MNPMNRWQAGQTVTRYAPDSPIPTIVFCAIVLLAGSIVIYLLTS